MGENSNHQIKVDKKKILTEIFRVSEALSASDALLE